MTDFIEMLMRMCQRDPTLDEYYDHFDIMHECLCDFVSPEDCQEALNDLVMGDDTEVNFDSVGDDGLFVDVSEL